MANNNYISIILKHDTTFKVITSTLPMFANLSKFRTETPESFTASSLVLHLSREMKWPRPLLLAYILPDLTISKYIWRGLFWIPWKATAD